jgi:hypothetical protein
MLAAVRERLLNAASGGVGGAAPALSSKEAKAYQQMAASLEKRLFQVCSQRLFVGAVSLQEPVVSRCNAVVIDLDYPLWLPCVWCF